MNESGKVKILCTGDLHLGRRPSRISRWRAELGIAHVWEKIVETAITHRVDLVVLTGDVVDRENRYFEAMGPLEKGVRRLKESGICTYAVSGNHDFDVLPRLNDALGRDGFYLLGRGGEWEEVVVERDGKARVRLVGWSYPSQHVKRSPLASLPELAADLPAVGLLHADLDNPASDYAPVSMEELERSGVSTWLLGHIHRPTLTHTSSMGLFLYPGSPQPLRPPEGGLHGAWLVEIDGSGRAQARQMPLATLRYQELVVDLSDVDDKETFQVVVPGKVREELQRLAREQDALRHVVYRITLRGRTRLHRHLEEFSERLREDLALSFDNLESSIDAIRVETSPAVDLEQLALGHDPPGVLAGLLLEAQSGTIQESQRPLWEGLVQRLRQAHGSTPFGPLLETRVTEKFVDDREIREMMIRQGLSLLDEMLAQKEEEGR